MDNTRGITGAYVVNNLPVGELERILKEYGEERWARRIARSIDRFRRRSPIRTTKELADIVCRAVPRGAHPKKIHPATRSFLALRIAVNNELEALKEGLRSAVDCTIPGGRIVVITYQSLEDRLVKQIFRGFSTGTSGRNLLILTRKPLLPNREEVLANPRARSAKMRAAEILKEVPEE
jgi:16S rRNA (cytosine1402-N4)-methyltransferase